MYFFFAYSSDNSQTTTKVSKSNTGTIVGVVFGLIVAILVLIMVSVFLLKRNGKINSYLPAFMRKYGNAEMSYSKQEDSDLIRIVNKNYK